MMRMTVLLASAALAVVGMGCGGGGSSNPLIGTWVASVKGSGGVTTTTSADLESGGVLTLTVTSPSCTGSATISGLSWTSTATTLTFSGTPACTTSLSCDGVSIACTENGEAKAGVCTYALTGGNDTLTLSGCSAATVDGTYTRGGL